MEKRTTILVSTLFVLIIIGMFAFTYLKSQELPTEDAAADTAISTDPAATNTYGVTNITAKRFYEDGVHTIVGEIDMPTPCDLLETEATVQESMPEQINFAFTVLNTADTCAQVITPQRFMISAQASELADLRATFMGEPVTLNITEAEPGETPEDFELFIKG